MVTVGSGVRRICVLPRSTSFSKLQPAAGVSEGSNLTRMLAPWIVVGVLQFTSLDFAITLFGMIATSWFPVRMCVARQLVPTTVTAPARKSGSVAAARMEECEMVISELAQLSRVTEILSRSGWEIALLSHGDHRSTRL